MDLVCADKFAHSIDKINHICSINQEIFGT